MGKFLGDAQVKVNVGVALVLLLSSCSPMSWHHVDVDSISSPVATLNSKYVLAPGDAGVKISGLRFQEYSSYVHTALQKNGFIKVNTVEEANIVILFNYGISSPKETSSTYSIPIYGQTQAESTSHSVFGTTYTPAKSGIIGYNQGTSYSTSYDRFFKLYALDAKQYLKTKETIDV